MKRTLFIGFLLITFQSVFAQNWTLFNPDFEYHYSYDGSGEVDQTVKVDSFQVDGTDTTFHLNRIVKNENPRSEFWGAIYGDIIINKPTLFDYKCLKKSGLYSFSSLNNFNLFLTSKVDSSWVFKDDVTARITKKHERSIFSITDSVMIIELSTNDSIVISKRFGVIDFPDFETNQYYHLVGVNDSINEFGEVPLNYHSIFDFNVGDQFFYYLVNTCSCDYPSTDIDKYRVEIIEITEDSGLDRYKIKVNSAYMKEDFDIPYGDTVFVSSVSTYDNFFNDYISRFYDKELVNSYLNEIYNHDDFNMSSHVRLGYDEDGKRVKYIGNKWRDNGEIDSLTALFSLDYDFLEKYKDSIKVEKTYQIEHGSYFSEHFFIHWTEGLGFTEYSSHIFEASNWFKMVGYIKDGKEYGEIYGDDVLTSIETKEDNFSIFPTSFSDHIFIKSDNFQSSNLSILTLEGKIVRRFKLNNSIEKLNLSDLPNGVYLIEIQTVDQVYTQKIIKE